MDKPKCWVRNVIKRFTVEKKVEVGLTFLITFLTQPIYLIPNLGENNPALFD